MPVQIGAKTHSFSDPTALLSDCHRRIEMFLGALEKVAALIDQPLANDTRVALKTALRYFREAAPKHTADEEVSVFPRLRRADDAEMKNALATLDSLEQEHRRADHLHARVDVLGKRALEESRLPPADATAFQEGVAELASIYKAHIRIEDDLIFPIAGRVLSRADKQIIATEMSARRK